MEDSHRENSYEAISNMPSLSKSLDEWMALNTPFVKTVCSKHRHNNFAILQKRPHGFNRQILVRSRISSIPERIVFSNFIGPKRYWGSECHIG